MSAARELVEGTSNKVGWVEFLIPLIPVFAEVLQQILEECANTEDDAVALVTDPTPLQAMLGHRRIVKAMRANGVPRKGRRAVAWSVFHDVVAEAQANEDLVVKAYKESCEVCG